MFSREFEIDLNFMIKLGAKVISREYKGQQPLPSFVFVFVNVVQSVILEAVENKSLTSCKHCLSLHFL